MFFAVKKIALSGLKLLQSSSEPKSTPKTNFHTILRDEGVNFEKLGLICRGMPQEVKTLGVTIDRHLSYKAHVGTLTKKYTGMLIALNHSRHVIPNTTLATLVQGLIISNVR